METVLLSFFVREGFEDPVSLLTSAVENTAVFKRGDKGKYAKIHLSGITVIVDPGTDIKSILPITLDV